MSRWKMDVGRWKFLKSVEPLNIFLINFCSTYFLILPFLNDNRNKKYQEKQ